MISRKPFAFRLAARGLIVEQDRLLLVSDDGEYWYLPGGRLEPEESLLQCVEREVFEETGLVVKAGRLANVLESFDLADNVHKINFFFETKLLRGALSEDWKDEDGTVEFRRFFSLKEIQGNERVVPHFLHSGDWLPREFTAQDPYVGFLVARGLELAPMDLFHLLISEREKTVHGAASA